MPYKGTVLYIGGFELPDKNAAAQRVVGIAKSLRDLGYKVVFINAIKNCKEKKYEIKRYFGFKTIEYGREDSLDYLVGAFTVINHIKHIKPNIVIAYNYPAFSLSKINNYCKSNAIKCIADVTEWYDAKDGNIIHRIIKKVDTECRMRYVHKKLSGIIAISRYLYDYYKNDLKTVMIPPTVDIADEKWNVPVNKSDKFTTFVYAGSPSAEKEKLDLVVDAIETIARSKPVQLNVVGITRNQFIQMYSWKKELSEYIVFWGRIDHKESLKIVKNADWSIVLRDNTRLVKAGFPTKLVESISCGTAIIANNFSNIIDYLTAENSIIIDTDVQQALEKSCKAKKYPRTDLFDFHRYNFQVANCLENSQINSNYLSLAKRDK